MKKKFFAIFMAMVMCLAFAVTFTGCGSDDADTDATEAVESTEAETASDNGNTKGQLSDLAGDWQDTYSQRASMTIIPAADGKTAEVVINWSESSSECEQWKMTVKQEGKKLVYDSCEETETEYDADGNVVEEEVSSEEGGYFEIGSSKELNWTGAADDDCRSCSFVLYTE